MSETTRKITTRRAMMGNAGLAALAGIAGAAIAKPDAQAVEILPNAQVLDTPLSRLCARFMALQTTVDACNAGAGADDDEIMDRLIRQQASLLNEMEDLRAASPTEQRARARVLMAWYGVNERGENYSAFEWHRVRPLFRDLLGETV